MENNQLEQLRYPIGKFEAPSVITKVQLEEWITVLEYLPQRLQDLVTPLSDGQLETPYRPGGWTVRQLVHHISDSHHNSYIRFKWALTENNPVIKPYDEKAWADLFDSRTAPIQMSLDHLRAVHAKLVYLLKGLSVDDLQRKFTHPDGNVESTLEVNIGRYAWHSNHHYAHIANLVEREGW
ncbi:putative metal-dependent hydrolase [Flagellimonas taeanensis]|uniref:YfiT family bacillithiol transferase n=1 Tax=Flavobacteriaceae TaxID=49546 RepID=UPI000E68E379|nr:MULTISPECIES: bacillithiol transferase BstA [Allomuricauda]MDC6384445.1 bacillithiol transferase BstA [Muricauda sp. SK9]RIV52129.1 putative metal-dependent hydrolase [Allomuricauda taeanensis]